MPDPRWLILLSEENLTPPHRTPWGGVRIRTWKGLNPGGPLGESWELSVGPELPSPVAGSTLTDLIARHPTFLGRESRLGRPTTALLVKALDAGDDLSVQVHPSDAAADASLAESGKPEAWYVVAHDPGAVIYFGFRDGVSRSVVEDAIARRGEMRDLLEAVPVAEGDAFVVRPGTPHAIGAGVFVIEPQRVLPGRRGVTYRFWDWSRRYDREGRPSATGVARELHVDRALAVTDWTAPRGAALLASSRGRFGRADVDGAPRLDALFGPGEAVASNELEGWRLSGTGTIDLPPHDSLRSLTILDGTVTLARGPDEQTVRRGQSAALAADIPGIEVRLRGCHAILASVR